MTMTQRGMSRRKDGPMKIFRQGDVLIRQVAEVPEGLRLVPREGGRAILALGEVTGHAHAVVGDVELLASDVEEMRERFLRVERAASAVVDAYRCRNDRGQVSFVPAYTSPEKLEAAGLTIVGHEEVEGVVVAHEEHTHLVLEPGDYSVGIQVEYAPEEIRTVAD